MKISYVHGVCVKNDAISNSIRDEISWLVRHDHNDVRLYAYACDHADLPFIKVSDLKNVAFDQHFQSSDLVVFHFGVFYPLFDLLAITPKRAKRLVVFHNITPKEFVSIENHPVIDQSFKQLTNISFADHVACDSQTNLDVLRASGIQTPATVLPLAVHSNFHIPESKPSFFDGVVRLAFIGRFVRSKGPGQLLEAFDSVLRHDNMLHMSLDMIGNLSFSDLTLLEEMKNTVEAIHKSYGGRAKITIHGDATEEIKREVLANADLFVLPTYHEGFCVPILEALGSGCKVIAYDNSNTPAISGGFARLTPTGDVEELSFVLAEVVRELTSSAWRSKGSQSYAEYSRKVEKYVLQYSPEHTKHTFMTFIDNFVS